MSVEIDPLELGFPRPFTSEIGQVLKIKNPNSSPVAFKVKTTAPKHYCVRPNSGRIEPGHEIEVSILLQAMRVPPAPDAKCRDKFLVQSVIITPDKEFTNVQQIWDSVDKAAIQEKKIRVNWLPAPNEEPSHTVGTPVRKGTVDGFDAIPDTAPPAYSSPQRETSALQDASAVSQAGHNEPESTQATQATAYGGAAATDAVPGGKTVAAEAYEELKEQLARAEATIASLKNELAGGLRRRNTEAAPSGDGSSAQGAKLARAERQPEQQPPRATEGVPVPVVAVLCLISFLLAYFLF
ncbi:hypothetical protein VTH06DRAFT_4527 [Thermothelomyces fergusii]